MRRVLDATVLAEEARLSSHRWRHQPRLRHEYANLPEYVAMRTSSRCQLERFDRALQFLFKNGDVRLGHVQWKLMNAMRSAIIMRVFGDTVVDHMDWIRQRYGKVVLHDAWNVRFPRRQGKTTTATMAVAAILVSQPNGNMACFSIMGRQARSFLSQVCRYLAVFQKSDEFRYDVMAKNSNEFITIRSPATGTNNRVSCYPGGSGKDFKNLRGEGERLFGIMIDETEFMYHEAAPVIIPLGANGAFYFFTSSAGKRQKNGGFMAILKATYPDGRKAIRQLDWVEICDDCQRAGTGRTCEHNVQRPQFFQTHASRERTSVLLSPFEGANESEMLNRVAEEQSNPVFIARYVDMMTARTSDVTPTSIRDPMVYMTLDPFGGGDKSDAVSLAAIVGSSLEGLKLVVPTHSTLPLLLLLLLLLLYSRSSTPARKGNTILLLPCISQYIHAYIYTRGPFRFLAL